MWNYSSNYIWYLFHIINILIDYSMRAGRLVLMGVTWQCILRVKSKAMQLSCVMKSWWLKSLHVMNLSSDIYAANNCLIHAAYKRTASITPVSSQQVRNKLRRGQKSVVSCWMIALFSYLSLLRVVFQIPLQRLVVANLLRTCRRHLLPRLRGSYGETCVMEFWA